MESINIDPKKTKEWRDDKREKEPENIFVKSLDKNFPQDKAEELLKDPNLINIINKELDKFIVGEEKTRIAIFIQGCGIWVKGVQTNTLVNSESSTGKSYICKKIYDLFPEDKKQYRTKITSQAFTYWHDSKSEPDWTWDGKICYLEDVSYSILNSDPLKLMCSEGSKATVVRNQIAVDIEINGKPCILITTASAEPNNEIFNRFDPIQLDETPEQTQRILEKQAKQVMSSEVLKYDPAVLEALKKLKRVEVKIPYADKLHSYFPINNVRIRRGFKRFLLLIQCSTALYQEQRRQDINGNYIATEQDYEIVRELMEVFQTNTIQLPYKIKKAYQCCLKMKNNHNYNNFTATEIYQKYPIVSQRSWYSYLENLSSMGLLKIETDKREHTNQQVTVYIPIEQKENLKLPEFKKL